MAPRQRLCSLQWEQPVLSRPFTCGGPRPRHLCSCRPQITVLRDLQPVQSYGWLQFSGAFESGGKFQRLQLSGSRKLEPHPRALPCTQSWSGAQLRWSEGREGEWGLGRSEPALLGPREKDSQAREPWTSPYSASSLFLRLSIITCEKSYLDLKTQFWLP